ncbi:MAG: glycosyltransferase family 4 protein [Bacteroidales bacterium]|nr:glycosyltransferase family 4 protein [Bacteroidales bacterium]
MNITVNTRVLLKNKLEGIGWFTYETLKRITQNHPEHNFYFIFDRSYSKEFIFSDNVQAIVIGPQARHPVLFYYWFEKSVSKILKQINADIFISPDGFLSLRSNIKSIAVIHDISFVHNPKDFPFGIRNYYQYFFPRFAQKANKIVTVSEFSKQDIAQQYNLNAENIDVVYNGSNEIYKPSLNDEILKAKQQYTGGADFFIFVGALSPRKNVANLLSAFDLFKSKTKSNLKLVIVGEKMFKTKNIKDVFNKMSFKNDIVFTGRMDPFQLKNLYSAAFALTYVPYFEGFGIPIIEAMNCDTAVITSNVTSMPEVAGDAALFVNPVSVQSIADAMIKIYNGPHLRNQLIEKGKIQRQKFSWDKTAEKFWKSIEKVLNEQAMPEKRIKK